MTRKKWSFLFTVCLVTALIGCGQKNSQVDKNNNEELNKLGQIQVISREEGSGTRDTFASLAGFNKDGADGIDKTVNTATIADSMDSVIETVNKKSICDRLCVSGNYRDRGCKDFGNQWRSGF